MAALRSSRPPPRWSVCPESTSRTRLPARMPEIGASLREARMRARIDISELEFETKIRAKYLRALENEEWDLLPGPTFVKSFLRTYADALELDSKLLVEEYKLRHERLPDQELQRPIGAAEAGRKRNAGPRPPGVPRWLIVAACGLALLGALFALGTLGGDDKGDGTSSTPTAAAPTTSQPAASTPTTTRTTTPAATPPK